jgi:DNA repair exonuclease SbcCD ATPase subunit
VGSGFIKNSLEVKEEMHMTNPSLNHNSFFIAPPNNPALNRTALEKRRAEIAEYEEDLKTLKTLLTGREEELDIMKSNWINQMLSSLNVRETDLRNRIDTLQRKLPSDLPNSTTIRDLQKEREQLLTLKALFESRQANHNITGLPDCPADLLQHQESLSTDQNFYETSMAELPVFKTNFALREEALRQQELAAAQQPAHGHLPVYGSPGC